LIELLVVIVIIGILAGVIMISTSSSISKATIGKLKVFENNVQNSLGANMISRWKFDQRDGSIEPYTTPDSWGTNTATFGSGTAAPTLLTETSGLCVTGGCMNFGSGDYITVANASEFNFGSYMSAFAWVKAPAVNTGTIICNWENTVINKASWWMGASTVSPYNKFRVVITDDGSGSTTHRKNYYTSVVAFDNNWHLVGFTWNNGILKLFVDGLESSVTMSEDISMNYINYPSVPISIASYLNNGVPTGGPFAGLIDDVKIYNGALSSSQIKQNYIAGLDFLLSKNSILREEYGQRIQALAEK
jgi:hypothetical protein